MSDTDNEHTPDPEVSGTSQGSSVKLALEALGISEEDIQIYLAPLIAHITQAVLAPIIQEIPNRVQQITLEQVQPTLELFTKKANELTAIQQPPQETVLANTTEQQPVRGLARLTQNPEVLDKVLEKALDKLFSPKESDDFASLEKAAESVQRMRGIVNSFMIPTGYDDSQMQKVALDSLTQGMRIKAAAQQGGGPVTVPLAVQPVDVSLNRLNGHSKQESKSLRDFYA